MTHHLLVEERLTHHPSLDKGAARDWFWKNGPGYKPVLILIAAVVFLSIFILPPPQNMLDMVRKVDPPGYKLGQGCTTIADTVNKKLRPEAFKVEKQGKAVNTNSIKNRCSPPKKWRS